MRAKRGYGPKKAPELQRLQERVVQGERIENGFEGPLKQMMVRARRVLAVRQAAEELGRRYLRGDYRNDPDHHVSVSYIPGRTDVVVIHPTGCYKAREVERPLRVPLADEEPIYVRAIVNRPCEAYNCNEAYCIDQAIRRIQSQLWCGVSDVPVRRLRFWTITPPGRVEDAKAWNACTLKRFAKVWRAMRRRYPYLQAYYVVHGLQERELYHLHVVVRQSESTKLPKKDVGVEGWVTSLLARHGFGAHTWKAIKPGSVHGVITYVSHNFREGVDVTHALSGRLVSRSQNWARGWRDYRRRRRQERESAGDDGVAEVVSYRNKLRAGADGG